MKRLSAIIMGIMLLLATLTGCGSEEKIAEKTQEIHLAVVLGSHLNAPQVNLGLIEDLVYQACFTYGSVTLICDDGDPYTVVVDIPAQEEGLSDSKYIQIANEETQQILTAASQMQARTAEVDTLKAIQLGARSLNSVESESDDAEAVRKMVICDSCLSTTGALSFSDHNLCTINADDIVSQLEEMDEIPDLNGISVTVYTCGDTAGAKQKALPEENRKALKEVWESILTAGHADVNMKDDLPLSSTYDEDTLPEVSPVMIVQDSVVIHDEEETEDMFADGGVISFDEKSIAFCSGTADLADEAAAEEALTYVVEYMKKVNPDFKLMVCGCTACWGGEQYCKELSYKRAEVICKLLEKQGIESTRLTAVGVGYSVPEFYTNDQTADGKLDESIAPLNRSVKLLDSESDTAARIRSIES